MWQDVMAVRSFVAAGDHFGELVPDLERALPHSIGVASGQRCRDRMNHVDVEGIHTERWVSPVLGCLICDALAQGLCGLMPRAMRLVIGGHFLIK